MKYARKCPACWGTRLSSHGASLSPFVNYRLTGQEVLVPGAIGEDGQRPWMRAMPACMVMECEGCGFAFSDIRPEPDEMARLYAEYPGERYSNYFKTCSFHIYLRTRS